MKVLHIITRLIVGGAQENTVASCVAQVAAGHQVSLAYGPIYGPEGSLLEAAKRSGAELVEVKSMRRAVLPVHDFICIAGLRRLIARVKPDIVHTHSSKAGILGRSAAWREKVPGVIHTVHGLPFHPRQPRIVYRAYVGAERFAATRCHKLIAITQAMVDAFVAEKIAPAEKFVVIPSGLDLGAFNPPAGTRQRVRRELGIADDAPLVGIVARLDKLKGQDDLLDILPALAAEMPGIKLLFVGDGWYRDHLAARVAKKGLQERVIFTGLVPPARVAELLAAMDVKALPSYQEGQSRTLIQALLCGAAIVGYDAGGIPEICIDGVTGRLVKTGDKSALRDAIAALLRDPVGGARLVENGRSLVRVRFDAREMVRRLQAVYEEVLADHQSGKVKN